MFYGTFFIHFSFLISLTKKHASGQSSWNSIESPMVIVEKKQALDPFIQQPEIQQNPQNIENAESSYSEMLYENLQSNKTGSLCLHSKDSVCIELFEIESRFDTRKINYTEKIPVARCVIGGENLPVNSAQMVKFIVGNSTYDSDFIDGEHILKIIPTRHFDKTWVSCVISVAGNFSLSSSTTFPLSVKYYPTKIDIEVINGIKLDNDWLVQQDKRFMIFCKVDGNPRPSVKIYINSIHQKRKNPAQFLASLSSFNQTNEIECSVKHFNLNQKQSFTIASLAEPEVQVKRSENEISYHCQCNGYPKPTATWTREPKLQKMMLSKVKRKRATTRRGFSRKLWRFNKLSSNDTLRFSSLEKVKKLKPNLLVCGCMNALNSKMKIIHKMRSISNKTRSYIDIWSTKVDEVGDRYVMRFVDRCSDDVCQLKMSVKSKKIFTYGIQCNSPEWRNQNHATIASATITNSFNSSSIKNDTNVTSIDPVTSSAVPVGLHYAMRDLYITVDNKKVHSEIMKELPQNGIFANISLPITKDEYSTRIRRDRDNKQKSCVHKISCYNGDNLQLEQMKIMPNYLKAPVLGVQRHSNFKELRKPFRVSKPKYSTVSLVCMSDSIPLSSILWVRNDEVISKSNYLTIKNATISDSGKYRCLAANTIGTKYSELKLRIH